MLNEARLEAEREYEETDFKNLQRFKSFVGAYFFDSKRKGVKCALPGEVAGLWGVSALEDYRAHESKYILYSSKAGYLFEAKGFNDTDELREACEDLSRPASVSLAETSPDYGKEPTLDQYKKLKIELLLRLGFPQEYLWTVKCRTTEEFRKRWKTEAASAASARDLKKKYMLHVNYGHHLAHAVGFDNYEEFQQACAELAAFDKKYHFTELEEEIGELEIDLPRKWEYQRQRTDGGEYFAGVAYLREGVRQSLCPEEIMYVILKIQQRVRRLGAVEAVQTFKSEDNTTVLCVDGFGKKTDGWEMMISPL